MKQSTARRINRIFSGFFHGIKGGAIFFMLGIMFFALLKLVFILIHKDLFISKYTIAATLALFIIAGIIYGIFAYNRHNYHYKMYSMTRSNFIIDLVLTIIFTLYFWFVLRSSISLSSTVYLFFILAFVLFYAFSALIGHIFHHIKKGQHKKIRRSTVIYAVVFNPIFVLIYLWLFSLVLYTSLYVPCGVSIAGIDKNAYTANTLNMNISSGTKLLAINNANVSSIEDVRNYMNSLTSTSQVRLYTTNQTYYIWTYMNGEKRYMGLLLQEDICSRDY